MAIPTPDRASNATGSHELPAGLSAIAAATAPIAADGSRNVNNSTDANSSGANIAESDSDVLDQRHDVSLGVLEPRSFGAARG